MIKKSTFISLLLFLILQNIEAQKFKGGLHLGLIASQVDGDFRGNYNKPGLFTGAYVLIPFKQKIMSLQMEIDYAQKGSKSQGKNYDGTLNKSRMALHQIEIPVLFNFNIIRKITLSGGLSCNMLVSTKIYDSYGYTSELYADPYKFKFFELGLLLGGSYLFKEHYGLSFRYGYSLTPIGTSLDTRRRLVSGLRNNFLQFHFSYQF